MIGQYSIFDAKPKTRPCDYSFQRYIGQKVIFTNRSRHRDKIGEVVDIFPYYTYIKTENGEILVGSPYGDFKPYEEAENE